MFYVVSSPLGLLSTTHAEQTQAYISPSAAMQQLQTGVTRYHDVVISLWAVSRYRDPLQISTIRALHVHSVSDSWRTECLQQRTTSEAQKLYISVSADSQPKSVGLVWGLAATRRSVCIHQMNRVNSPNDDYVIMTTPQTLSWLLLYTLVYHTLVLSRFQRRFYE